MPMKKGNDITIKILISIRDEIVKLREDTNARFEQMDKRFARIENDIASMKNDIASVKVDIKSIVARFDNDYLLLASEVHTMKSRLTLCESEVKSLKQAAGH